MKQCLTAYTITIIYNVENALHVTFMSLKYRSPYIREHFSCFHDIRATDSSTLVHFIFGPFKEFQNIAVYTWVLKNPQPTMPYTRYSHKKFVSETWHSAAPDIKRLRSSDVRIVGGSLAEVTADLVQENDFCLIRKFYLLLFSNAEVFE